MSILEKCHQRSLYTKLLCAFKPTSLMFLFSINSLINLVSWKLSCNTSYVRAITTFLFLQTQKHLSVSRHITVSHQSNKTTFNGSDWGLHWCELGMKLSKCYSLLLPFVPQSTYDLGSWPTHILKHILCKHMCWW